MARLYTSVEKAAMGLLRKKYGYTNQAQIRNIINEPRMSGYFNEAQKLFNKGLNEASRRVGANWHKPQKVTRRIEPKMWGPTNRPLDMSHPDFTKKAEIKSLLQEAVKRLEQKKQRIRNAKWRKDHTRTRLTETIMSEAAEDFILGQGNN